MSKAKILCVASVLLSLTGCAGVVSLHPLALPNGEDTIFDPALQGTWEQVKAGADGVKTRYTVDRAESGYKVTAVSGSTRMEGTMHLMKVGNRKLLDVLYLSDSAPPPAHLFFRLRLENDVAWVAEMDSEWLQDQIETCGLPRHEILTEGDSRMVLTASTAELRRRLLPYFGDDKSFGDEVELRRAK